MFSSYVVRILRGAVALLMPISSAATVGVLTGSPSASVAIRTPSACAATNAPSPRNDTVLAVSRPVSPKLSFVAEPNAAVIARSPAAPVETTQPPGLPIAGRALDTAKVVITLPDHGVRRAWDQVLDIARRADGRVLTGRPVDDAPANSHASESMATRPGANTPDEVVFEVPRGRLECAVRLLASSHLRAFASYAQCRPETLDKTSRVSEAPGPAKGEVRIPLPITEGRAASVPLPELRPTTTREIQQAVGEVTPEPHVERAAVQPPCAVEFSPRLGSSPRTVEAP